MKARTVRGLLAIILLIAFTASCENALLNQLNGGDTGSDESAETGGITILLASLRAQNLLAPDLDMSVASLTVSGSGPFQESFTETIGASDSSYSKNDLVAGEWTITVEAINATSQIVGRGSATVTVEPGATVQETIDVRPLPADGTLDVAINWPNLTVDDATVAGTLVASDETERTLTFDVSGNSASYTGSLPSGYYDLFIDLSGTNNRSWTHYVAVRIVEGQTTSGSLDLQLNQESGNLELIVTVDLLNPVDIAITGAPSTMYYGDTATLDLVLDPPDSGDYSYGRWILNGSPIDGETLAGLELSAEQLTTGTNVLAARVLGGSSTSAKSLAIEYVDALPEPMVSVPGETTEARPTWSWDTIEGAQGVSIRVHRGRVDHRECHRHRFHAGGGSG